MNGSGKQNIQIIAVHLAIYKYLLFIFFFRWSVTVVAQAVVQWCARGLPQPLLPGFKQFSASWLAGITGPRHHVWLIFVFLVEMGFHHIGEARLELLTSGDPVTSASQSAGITGVSRCTRPASGFLSASHVKLLPGIFYSPVTCIISVSLALEKELVLICRELFVTVAISTCEASLLWTGYQFVWV